MVSMTVSKTVHESSNLSPPAKYLAHWYRDCAAASKPAEVGLSPTWVTKKILEFIEILI